MIKKHKHQNLPNQIMMKYMLQSLSLLCVISCQNTQNYPHKSFATQDTTPTIQYDNQIIPEDTLKSTAIGTVGNGSLVNGVILPFRGKNYRYFSRLSYQAGRAYVHSRVRRVILDSYQMLESSCSNRIFYLMEGANKQGGPLPPHRTHQNGLSVDFMTLLQKDEKPYLGLDNLGPAHYALEFDKKGQWLKNKAVKIDFEVMARHIQSLEKTCKKHQMRISKIILKTNLQDELFASPTGQKLKHLPFISWLPDVINKQHDDHYHIDFELIK